MKVVVTGGSGRVGRYAIRELDAAGHSVVNLDRTRPVEPLPGRFVQLDLTDAGEVYDALAQVDPEGVCHIAANPSPSGYPRQQTFGNNVLSTYNVMQAAGDSGVRRLVYASSEMATGWLTTDALPPRFPFSEEDRVASPNAYALSKYMGEVIADAMALRYPEMPICSLRINNVILPEHYDTLQYRRDHFPAGAATFGAISTCATLRRPFAPRWRGRARGTRSF